MVTFRGTIPRQEGDTIGVELSLVPRPLSDAEVARGWQHDADDIGRAPDVYVVAGHDPTWFRNCYCAFCDARRDPGWR